MRIMNLELNRKRLIIISLIAVGVFLTLFIFLKHIITLVLLLAIFALFFLVGGLLPQPNKQFRSPDAQAAYERRMAELEAEKNFSKQEKLNKWRQTKEFDGTQIVGAWTEHIFGQGSKKKRR